MKNYKLRKDLSIEFMGRTLFRIEAIKDIAIHNVKKGDLGGYIQNEKNLAGNAWVSGNAWVYGDAKVSGNAWVYGDAKVSGNAEVYGDAWVYGDAEVSGNAKVSGDTITNNDDVYNISCNSTYNITITPKCIQIGCKFFTKEEWWNFTDREIKAMDGLKAIRFWKKWKPILQAICDYKEIGEE